MTINIDIRNRDTTQYTLNADYVAGLIESDGSFVLDVGESKSFRVHICISSLTNSNTLTLVKTWLLGKGINCTIDLRIVEHVPLKNRVPGMPSSRANLTIAGNRQVERFLKILAQEITSEFMFCGVKQRDYLLVRAFFKTQLKEFSPITQANRLAIQRSMHKSNYLDENTSRSKISTTEKLEGKLELIGTDLSGKIKASSIEILKEVDHTYEVHRLSIRRAISEKRLIVAPCFIGGVVDGDGCLYITVSWKEPNSSYSKRHIHWEGCFTLSTDKNSDLLFDVLRFVFDLPSTFPVKPIKTPSTKDTTGAIGSLQIWVRNQTQMLFILRYFKGTLRGNYRVLQYYSVCKLFQMRNNGLLENKTKNIESMKHLLKEIYIISAISMTGSERNPVTIEEALSKTDLWLIGRN